MTTSIVSIDNSTSKVQVGGVDSFSFSSNGIITGLNFAQSGSGAVTRTVQAKLRDMVSVKDFGATGDGVTNDATAIQAAMDALTSGGTLFFPPGTYLCGSQITHKANIVCQGLGRPTIKKGFNGNLWGIAVSDAALKDLVLDGQHGTYTGKGVVCSGGAACWRPVFVDVHFTSFADTHLEFGANAGESAEVVACRFTNGSGQTDARCIHVNGPDTTAVFRQITACTSELCYIDLDGAMDVGINGGVFRRVETDSSCSQVFVSGMRWANLSTAMTIYGGTTVIGCSFSGSITLYCSFCGAFAANTQSTGTFTDNSTGSSVLHRYDATTGAGGTDLKLGKNSIFNANSGMERIQTSRVANVGSSDISLVIGSNARTIRFTNALTGNVTVTLPTTNAINGDKFRICRVSTATGAFTLSVGGLKNVAIGDWCDVEYNGSVWYVTAYGTL